MPIQDSFALNILARPRYKVHLARPRAVLSDEDNKLVVMARTPEEAALFAAAPDLLSVLEKVALFGENTRNLSMGHTAALIELGRNARAAIEQAKGYWLVAGETP